jgi:Fe-S-cluster-containing dehydrogenase component/formate-dependent nitrite reductase membrane component NrfD
MTRWGFVLDQTACIGCHACTVACKSENNVPVGAFRTWVKYIEKGTFPDVRRHFAVLRCNQCENSPCTEICPTVALFRRRDGIVDFDSSRCIGCKSCMQACPYDALYIDPATNTAAKCNYCAHRAEEGLEPACAIVCPEQAIIAGDLDDPNSRISQVLARKPVQVRKPEKNTRPKVYYLGADQAALDPMLADRSSPHAISDAPSVFPIEDASARVIYDVNHPAPWGLKVAAYLFTKAIAAGSILVAAVYGLPSPLFPAVALAFLLVTAALLIFDLKRPDRFYFLLTRPNFRSWLVWGGYILGLFGGLIFLWLVASIFGWESLIKLIRVPAAALALASACYSAFLFNQADGRDLWQGPVLFFHLLFGAVLAGGAVLSIHTADAGLAVVAFGCGACAVCLFVDLVTHRSAAGRRAVRVLLGYPTFWMLAILLGLGFPIALALLHSIAPAWPFPAMASISALIGLFEYERLWIKAGQAVPIS